MFKVLSYPAAVAAVCQRFAAMLTSDTVSVRDAAGAVCASDVISFETVPAFNRSTVDGYAVACADTNAASAASPAVFDLAGEVAMGECADFAIARGSCVYVPTGGMLPAGADAVAMTEDCERRGKEILLSSPLRHFENVAVRGEDITAGDAVLKRGDTIDACKTGALCAAGITRVEVYRKPRFYVISTGDELVGCDEPCPAGKVRDVNTELISAAAAHRWEKAGSERVKDDKDLFAQAVARGLESADVVIVSGGSSVGIADYTERLFAEFGDVFLHGVAVKPGKPTLAASCGKKLLVGLPGHPMAAFVSFKLIFERAYLAATGAERENFLFAEAAVNFAGGRGRACVMPVRLFVEDGKVKAQPLFYKSGMISVLARCDGFAVLPDYAEGAYKGERLEIYGL